MIIYKRNVTESDLKNSDEIIYYFDDYICYLITKVDNLFVVRKNCDTVATIDMESLLRTFGF